MAPDVMFLPQRDSLSPAVLTHQAPVPSAQLPLCLCLTAWAFACVPKVHPWPCVCVL